MGSRGSVIPFFLSQSSTNTLSVTDPRMTRFMITLEQGVSLVWHAFSDMLGGEIYVKKIPSMNIIDIAKSVNPNASIKHIGIRPGEKLHEQMIGEEDAPHTYEYENYFKILPVVHGWSEDLARINNGKKVDPGFSYNSLDNHELMSIKDLSEWIDKNKNKIGNI